MVSPAYIWPPVFKNPVQATPIWGTIPYHKIVQLYATTPEVEGVTLMMDAGGMGWWMGFGALFWIILIVLIIVLILQWLNPTQRRAADEEELEELRREVRRLRRELRELKEQREENKE